MSSRKNGINLINIYKYYILWRYIVFFNILIMPIKERTEYKTLWNFSWSLLDAGDEEFEKLMFLRFLEWGELIKELEKIKLFINSLELDNEFKNQIIKQLFWDKEQKNSSDIYENLVNYNFEDWLIYKFILDVVTYIFNVSDSKQDKFDEVKDKMFEKVFTLLKLWDDIFEDLLLYTFEKTKHIDFNTWGMSPDIKWVLKDISD